MTLLDVLHDNIAIKDLRVGYYGQSEQEVKAKVASDFSIILLEDEGIYVFRDLLKLPIKQIKDNCIYIYTNGDANAEKKISYFWDLYTKLGAFRWDGDYRNSKGYPSFTPYDVKLHSRYFTNTAEIIAKKIL